MPESHFPVLDRAIASDHNVFITQNREDGVHVIVSEQVGKRAFYGGKSPDLREALALAAQHFATGVEPHVANPQGKPTKAEANAKQWLERGGALTATKGSRSKVKLTATQYYPTRKQFDIHAPTLREALHKLTRHLTDEPAER